MAAGGGGDKAQGRQADRLIEPYVTACPGLALPVPEPPPLRHTWTGAAACSSMDCVEGQQVGYVLVYKGVFSLFWILNF